ncbi:EAL domain-containing protein [Methylobacterium sp. BTF04]|uniref:EAL domain-containing protein n=1 Tax=Methylobacterium sp. BTF04 TaxID=2708300 RepID=UPI0013D61190|nr:EAL domain-containing protein [Methylobacterium sp. BTF04]NEU14946.1 EAL domain-containing protein [Methylobacterium sp. BTF04]
MKIMMFKTDWMMSIRTKIFFGCISLAFVTILIGFLSQGAQTKLSDTALEIYDDAFQSMNYLRSAQSIILGVSRDVAVGENNRAVFIDQIQSALDALDVVRERTMSQRGDEIAKHLQTSVSNLQALLRDSTDIPARRDFQAVEQTFDKAVSLYASDGFQKRRLAEALVQETRIQTYAAMLGSVLIAFIITLLLNRAIVPSIQQSVRVATAIASGKLDNRIEGQGSSETGLLLQALATMQQSISEKIGFIERLMAQQASSYDVEIAAQNARFETALDHMTLGLRMFDVGNVLVVENRRFSELFSTEEAVAGVTGTHLLPMPQGAYPVGSLPASSGSHHCVLEDGRTIEVSAEAMAGGGRVVTYEDITDRQRAEARLSHMVRHDALTGLPNRVLFREHLHLEKSAEHGGGVLSVLCLDLDRFKAVNDTLGHPVGDELLRETARRLLSTIGEAGMVVRLGGDEFAIVQVFANGRADAEGLALRIIEVLSPPFEIDGHYISIGVSVGIAQVADGTETPDALLKNADLALYSAKAEGGSIHRFFEPSMNARVQMRRRMEVDLRVAIADQQFEVYYQPLVNAKSGLVVAFEALLRWHHPERGMVSPAEFIPIAEETGLIPVIGLWVLNRACRDATAWPSDVKVAINLSPLQFRYRNLVSDVEGALRTSGLAPSRLDLEITESLMLQNSDVTLTTLHALRALGIGIAMDDFGTGFSSLSYLCQFPFDKIKIDRSFIREMIDNKDGLAIVNAVIMLGESLRMNVVAEGVETVEQRDLLCQAGCHELQGYLFSRPHPERDVAKIISLIYSKYTVQ